MYCLIITAEDQLAKLERELKKRLGQLKDANDELLLVQQAIDEEVKKLVTARVTRLFFFCEPYPVEFTFDPLHSVNAGNFRLSHQK